MGRLFIRQPPTVHELARNGLRFTEACDAPASRYWRTRAFANDGWTTDTEEVCNAPTSSCYSAELSIGNTALAVNELHIFDASFDGGGPHGGEIAVITDSLLVAYSLSVEYSQTDVTVSDVNIDTTYLATVNANPDVFNTHIDASAGVFTVEYVIDATPPFSGVPLSPVPSFQPLAYFEYSASFPIFSPLTVNWTFADGVAGFPLIVNELRFLNGSSVASGSGLGLFSGVHELAPPIRFELTEDGLIEPNASDIVGVLGVNVTGPWQGFSIALDHGDLVLQSVDLDPAVSTQVAVEFVDTTIDNFSGGGTITAVFDANPPFDGQVVAPGSTPLRLANFTYSCVNHPTHPQPTATKPLVFVDGQIGTPPVDNGALVNGQSLSPFNMSGSIDCQPIFPVANGTFACGPAGDPSTVGTVIAEPGDNVTLGFYYSEPLYEVTAFELAVSLDCLLLPDPNSFTVSETATSNAEFINAAFDTDPNDGDGCEFIAAILLDFIPPFDHPALPIATDLLEFARVDVQVSVTSTLGSQLTIEMVDGIDGPGSSPFYNGITTFQSPNFVNLPIANLVACTVQVGVPFVRGDANTDGSLDIADAVVSLACLFQSGTPPTCLATADSNGDGVVNISDAVHLLTYLLSGGAAPPAPYPQCGFGSSTASCAAYAPCAP